MLTRSLCSGLCRWWSSDNHRESPEHFVRDYATNTFQRGKLVFW